MWFKNLALYRFTESFTVTAEDITTKLADNRFHPCGSHSEFSMGWTAPISSLEDELLHISNGFMMLCLKKEEKVLPTTVVNEMLQEKIAEIEEREARKLSKKDRTALKDELIFELLPRAFSFSKKTYAYIDPQGGWIVVDAASAKKAEDLLSYLRKCLGSLPVVPVNTALQPIAVMTQWLTNQSAVPNDLIIEDECELRSSEEDGGIVRCKRHNLFLPEISNHLDNNKQVIKLALSWNERLSFILDENYSIKRLKFLDLVQDQVADTEVDDEVMQFDVEFAIMTAELAHFLPRLLDVFGGEMRG